jgi:hypothetical protein
MRIILTACIRLRHEHDRSTTAEPSMTHVQRLLAASLLCLGFGGCQQPADAPPAAVDTAPAPATAEPPAPVPPAPVAPPANGEGIAYACDGGAGLSASYGDGDVTLRWPDGRSVTLPRAESASKGGGDVYVGDTVSLQRDGDRIELRDGDAPAASCTASG